MKLHGPADPDQFRVKVGYYRHYFDNLPANDIAPVTDATWPAVSSIKNAAGKDWSFTTMGRIAADLAANPRKYDGKAEQAIYNDLVALNKTELNRAQTRGIKVHELLEAKGAGRNILLENDDAEQYRPVVDQFLADCQPDVILSEVVVINRTVGYGGTGDAWVIINHPDFGRLLVDWKTRRSADKHDAYDEECWQVGGAYFHGEYMIVEEDGQAKRVSMPALDGAAIVSLAPESYKIYSINVKESWETFQRLYDFWESKAGKSFHGKPLYVKRTKAALAEVDPELIATLEQSIDVVQLRNRCTWIKNHSELGYQALRRDWPAGLDLKTGTPTAALLADLKDVLDRIERDFDVPFGPQPQPEVKPSVWTTAPPDEGPAADLVAVRALEAKVRKLSKNAKHWLTTVADETEAAGAGIRPWDTPTRRRFEIARAVVKLAANDLGARLPELLAGVIGFPPDPELIASGFGPVDALASLSADDAERFALHVDALVLGLADADTLPDTAA